MYQQLKNAIRTSFRWQALASLLSGLGGAVLLMIISRFIDNDDFGQFALISVVVGFGSSLFNLGLSQAIFSFPDIRPDQLSSLYWMSLAAGLFIYLLVYILAPILAHYYSTADLTPHLRLAGLTILINSLGFEYLVLLQKKLAFKQLAQVEIFSFFAQFISTSLLAVAGFQIMALIYSLLIRTGFNSALLLYYGWRHHPLKPVFRYSGIRPMLQFAYYQTGRFSAAYVAQKIDTILIGKFFGNELLGIYELFKRLLTRLTTVTHQVFGNVVLGVFANFTEKPQMLSREFSLYANMVFSILCFGFGGLMLAAHFVVRWMFGPELLPHTGLFIWVSISNLFWAFGIIPGQLLTATGAAKKGMYWNLFLIPVLLLIYWNGAGFGILPLIQLVILFEVISWWIYHRFVIKTIIPIELKAYMQLFLVPITITLIASLPGIFLLSWQPDLSLPLTVLALAFYTAVNFALSYAFNRSWIAELIAMLKINAQ